MALATFNYKVDDAEVEVRLNASGKFDVNLGDRVGTYDTLDALSAAIKRQRKAAKVEHSIPVVISMGGYSRGPWKRAILRGVKSGREREALLTIGGQKEQVKDAKVLCLGHEITEEELTNLNALFEATKAADTALFQATKVIEKRSEDTRREQGGPKYLNAESLIEHATAVALGEKQVKA